MHLQGILLGLSAINKVVASMDMQIAKNKYRFDKVYKGK